MKPIAALFGVGLFIAFLGAAIMPALQNFRSQDVTEPHNVTTAADITTADIVLANDLLDGNKVNVAITSPDPDDAPVAWEYVEATHKLTISGLQADTTRQLSVTYKVPRLDGASDLAARWLPTFLIIAGIAIVVGCAVSAFHK